jgi:hypothetical protein
LPARIFATSLFAIAALSTEARPAPIAPPLALESAAVRAELLSALSRSAPMATDAPELTDVTDRVLNAGLVPYCDMPEAMRRRISALSNARVTPDLAQDLERLLRENCRLRVYAQRVRAGKIFIVIYDAAPGATTDRIGISRAPGLALSVVRPRAEPSRARLAEIARATRRIL